LGIFGIWYGYGYCLFTDWHWRIRELLGYPNDSNSYIYFLILKLTGIHFLPWIDLTTAIVFTSYFISIYFAVKKIILNQKLKNNRRLNRFKKTPLHFTINASIIT
jgi:hypothetical protein